MQAAPGGFQLLKILVMENLIHLRADDLVDVADISVDHRRVQAKDFVLLADARDQLLHRALLLGVQHPHQLVHRAGFDLGLGLCRCFGVCHVCCSIYE
jgi:hypothetical protein